ncbi:hypothetical protein OIU77_028925 [Salix suchowensis]|uniref:Ycf15 n=1 Tax=Salix suchowensis TaxID=1278906 RepID=A0ABQ9BJ46_9ROSI|nr:hypothetical protein OIU77_028925 [Salix suchowensis]
MVKISCMHPAISSHGRELALKVHMWWTRRPNLYY